MSGVSLLLNLLGTGSVDSFVLLNLQNFVGFVLPMVFVLAGEILIRVSNFAFLLLWFSLDFRKFVLVEAVETLVHKVALLVGFTDFVKIVHVELNNLTRTCLTKEE